LLILFCLTGVAAALRFYGLGHQSFWYDEGLTVLEVHHALGRMLGFLPHIESNPPVYVSLAWAWVRIFGFGEAGLRSLSALAGVAMVPVMYGVGAKLVSQRAGLVAAALAAFNPLLVWYSQEARSYSLVVLFAAVAWLAFVRVRLPGAPTRWLVVWALAAGLTLATHYYGALAVVPQAVWLLVVHRRIPRAWLAVAAVVLIGLALLPLALAQRHLGQWIATYSLDRRLDQMTPQALLGTGAPARDWLKLAAMLGLIAAVAMLAFRADAMERRGALVAGAFALAGFALSLVLVLVGVDNLITRNLIVLLIPLIVLVAGGLGARRAGLLGLTGAATLCAVGLIATIGVAVDWRLQRPDWRGLARAVGPRPSAGEGRAVVVQHVAGLFPLALYLPGLRFMPRPGASVRELDVVAAGPGEGNAWFCWWGSACNLVPSTLNTKIRVPGFKPAGPVLRVNQFSVLRLVRPGPVRLTRPVVAHAMRHARLRVYFLYVQPGA
jgi:4-amino-4-deoxy-L-arabinose transferase-like glycosyltransferase